MRAQGLLPIAVLALSALSVSCPRPADKSSTAPAQPSPVAALPSPAPAPAVLPLPASHAPARRGPAPSPLGNPAASSTPAAPIAGEGSADALAHAPLPQELVDDGSDNRPELEPPAAAMPERSPVGEELASIAKETWIFAEPRW